MEKSRLIPISTWIAFFGSILLWASFAPLGWFWAAPLGIACWLAIIRQECPLSKLDYRNFWLAGAILWLALLQGVRLASWPMYFGWFALSFYLAIYTPLFIWLTRVAIQQWKCPLMLAAPVVWVGIELFRGYFVTGFSACLLGHTQVACPTHIQIADQLGAYGVSALIVIAGCVVLELIDWLAQRRFALDSGSPSKARARTAASAISILVGFALLGLSLAYGIMRVDHPESKNRKPLLRVALIQDNFPSIFEEDRDKSKAKAAWAGYLKGTQLARREFGSLDLVVWPESVFSGGSAFGSLEAKSRVPPEWRSDAKFSDLPKLLEVLDENNELKMGLVMAAANDRDYQIGAPKDLSSNQSRAHLLAGNDYLRIMDDELRLYNSAFFISPEGKPIGHYEKQHLVMFGEYIPLCDILPIYQLTGFPSIKEGEEYRGFRIGEVTIAPSICFESVLPHLVRWQIKQLAARHEHADILVNITNDSWFRGSSILDHHLACSTFAAVENRKPMLVAGNSGLSAWIDASGRQIKVSKRLTAESILAEPISDGRQGLWDAIGDLPAKLCFLACLLLGILSPQSLGRLSRFRKKQQ